MDCAPARNMEPNAAWRWHSDGCWLLPVRSTGYCWSSLLVATAGYCWLLLATAGFCWLLLATAGQVCLWLLLAAAGDRWSGLRAVQRCTFGDGPLQVVVVQLQLRDVLHTAILFVTPDTRLALAVRHRACTRICSVGGAAAHHESHPCQFAPGKRVDRQSQPPTSEQPGSFAT